MPEPAGSAGGTARLSSAPPELPPDGSPLPARLRIAAWITLATGLGLLAVVLTVRSSLLADVERDANVAIEQEVEEFRTFATEGRDPDTGLPFTSATRLLDLYLERQFPAPDEVLLGWDPGRDAADDADAAGADGLVLQQGPRTFGLEAEVDQVREWALGDAESGTSDIADETVRWGRVQVQVRGGEEVSAVFLVGDVVSVREREAAATVRLVVLVCLGGLLLTSLFAFAVAGVILAPVRAVRRAAGAITRTDMGRRIEVRGRDDVAALASTFNAMLDRVEGSAEAQQRFVRIAERDIRGCVATLQDEQTPAAERRRAVRDVAATMDALTLLAASRRPGFAELRTQDAEALARSLHDSALAAAPDHRWEADVAVDGEVPADPALLGEAVAALARNAATEHRGDRPLRFGCRGEPEAVEIWVEDDGPGLPEATVRALLAAHTGEQPDEQPDEQSREQPDGQPEPDGGLGLAVVRAVADAHEASAWAETSPGSGARFGLRLPRTPPAAPPRTTAPVAPGRTGEP